MKIAVFIKTLTKLPKEKGLSKQNTTFRNYNTNFRNYNTTYKNFNYLTLLSKKTLTKFIKTPPNRFQYYPKRLRRILKLTFNVVLVG